MSHDHSLPVCPGCVRLAEPADEDALLSMVQEMHADAEWGLRDHQGGLFPFSPDKARAAIQRAIIPQRNDPDANNAWIGVVGVPGGDLRGSAYVHVAAPWCSEGTYLTEVWNWVYPEHRRSDVSKSLISFSMAIADRMRLTLISAAITRERMAKARLYERKIGPPIGSLFLYNIGSA